MTIDPFLIGLIGSIILVTGAAWPALKVKHPVLSRKNQLFAVGNACMFAYAILQYFGGGSFFFILEQILIAVSTVLMLLNTKDRIVAPVIALVGSGLIVYSLYLFQGMETVILIVGLTGLGIGFAMNPGSQRRQIALGIGSALIAYFSYLVKDPIFLWLNTFFAIFSFYHAWRLKSASKG
ncbi:MAG: hypothetical protein QF793_01965 [Candidatus Peribacteraceae bacterium]|jgi:hypothetical protein|nr:hypothetical protein [bacterium]MDP6561669.1 hypothetical protein [Candidatus Peribacteraceae bacterium]